MKISILTLFPEMFCNVLDTSILGRARAQGLLEVNLTDIRAFSSRKHKNADDYPFGGGAGMVIEAAPVYECWQDIVRGKEKKPRVVYMTPKGRTFSQQIARELAQEEELILLCGHYEGIDQRALDMIVTDEISIGDYVLTGGELPALVVMDAVSRMVEGVLGNSTSAEDESFSGMYLEYPQYTRPRVFEGLEVPEVLLSGNHAAIEEWRLKESMKITLERRPDLLDPERMSAKERKIYAEIVKNHS